MTDEEQGRLRAYLDDELLPAEREAVEAELATSPALRAELEQLDQLDHEVTRLLAFDVNTATTESGAPRGLVTNVLPRPRRGVTTTVVALTALAAAVVLLLLWPTRGEILRGTVDAQQRETIAIGPRGIGVAEAQSKLWWTVDENGRAHVRQQRGSVFYRVEPGEAFEVETPAGTVAVTGTCFTVELQPMNNKTNTLLSAGAGATLATAILLTVHEGSVVLANDQGELEVRAGQHAAAGPGIAPRLEDPQELDDQTSPEEPPPDAPPPRTYHTLVAENMQQRAQLRELEAQRAAVELSAQPDPDDPAYRLENARDCAKHGGCEFRLWTDPSHEELQELAKCGRLLVDTPMFMGGGDFFPPGHVIEAAGLSEAEANRYAAMAEEFHNQMGQEYAELAFELGVPSELVQRLDATQLRGVVSSVIDDEVHKATRQRVANERAELAPPPALEEQSVAERAIRLDFGLGVDFQQLLGAEFGADAASEMRAAGGGWGSKSSMGDECSE
ncbi:MAG: FecR domain-containing protein [Myxococcota bacterium]